MGGFFYGVLLVNQNLNAPELASKSKNFAFKASWIYCELI